MKNRISMIMIAAILILTTLLLCACGESSNKTESAAKVCAQKAVTDALKSPSTAKFCKYTEMTATNLGGDRWKVTGYVDAQNSFGAVIRQNWTVTLTLTGRGFTDYKVDFS